MLLEGLCGWVAGLSDSTMNHCGIFVIEIPCFLNFLTTEG
jgi:hypothetical protein